MQMDLNKIFVAVTLIDIKPAKIVAIPAKWIKGLSLTHVANDGPQPLRPKKAFYSRDFTREPNHRLPICSVFDHNVDACYRVTIERGFKTLDETYQFIVKRCPNERIDYLDTVLQNHVCQHETEIDDELSFFHEQADLELPAPMSFDIKKE